MENVKLKKKNKTEPQLLKPKIYCVYLTTDCTIEKSASKHENKSTNYTS